MEHNVDLTPFTFVLMEPAFQQDVTEDFILQKNSVLSTNRA